MKGAAWTALLLCLFFPVWVCHASKELPPNVYVNRTLYPVIPNYSQRPLLSIGILSDIQYADKNEKSRRYFRLSPAKVEHAVKEMNANRSHLDLVMHLGDTVNHNIEVLGNHDFLLLNEKRRDDVYRLLGMPARYYSLQAGEGGGFLLIVLDGTDLSVFATRAGTARREEANAMLRHYRHRQNAQSFNGGIGKEQMEWLRMQLEYAAARKLVVLIFCHFPMYPYKNVLNIWNDKEVVYLLSNYSCVAAVISGHTHRWEHEQLVVAHKEGNFTIHFVTFGGVVQSPFISWGFIEAYANELHLHGLTFGRAFDYRLRIGNPVGEALTQTKPRTSATQSFARRQNSVRVISRCGDNSTWLERIEQHSVVDWTMEETEDVSYLMVFEVAILFTVLVLTTLLWFRHWKYRRRSGKSAGARRVGMAN